MTIIREILVDWVTPAGSGFRTVTHWSTVTPVATQRASLEALTDALAAALDNNVSCTIETSGREFEDTTGVLTGAWADATARSSVGSVAGEPVADATQVLIRWESPSIANGRFITGRSFIPGMASAQLVSGNASQILVDQWTGFAQNFVNSGSGFRVWHRPKGGVGGVAVSPTVGRAVKELAVLRRRRK